MRRARKRSALTENRACQRASARRGGHAIGLGLRDDAVVPVSQGLTGGCRGPRDVFLGRCAGHAHTIYLPRIQYPAGVLDG